MRQALNRRPFLLAAPGAEGYGNVRPFRPGVNRSRRAYTGENRLRETLTLYCEPETAVSPGDGVFPPGETAFETPLYLIRAVIEYPDHVEAEAERMRVESGE